MIFSLKIYQLEMLDLFDPVEETGIGTSCEKSSQMEILDLYDRVSETVIWSSYETSSQPATNDLFAHVSAMENETSAEMPSLRETRVSSLTSLAICWASSLDCRFDRAVCVLEFPIFYGPCAPWISLDVCPSMTPSVC